MGAVVGLVQINWDQEWAAPAEGEGPDAISYSVLPYSTGILQSYAAQFLSHPDDFTWMSHVYARTGVAETADRLRDCDAVGFSSYIWNIEYSLSIARELKRLRPQVLTVFGGPQVPDRAEAFLRANPCVDIACHGAGEVTFTAILENLGARSWSEIPGVSYLDAGGAFCTSPAAPRTTDLSSIPSPYLAGVFDSLVEEAPGTRWMMAWETNRGCPFSCTFCDWGSATASRVYSFDMERLRGEIAWASRHEVGVVFCCDANFGMLPRDIEIARLVVDAYRTTGFPYTFSVQNAKNSTERSYEVQKLLARNMNTTGVTLSLQTTDSTTLRNIRRANIRQESYRELQRRFNQDGIYTYTDVIIGLPGETYDAFVDSVSRIISDGQRNHIEFYNCSVLPNAEMGNPEYIARFGISTVPQPIRSRYSPESWKPEIEEYLPIVVTTDAMDGESWIRSKVFSWMTDLLFFDRLLQIPLTVVHEVCGVSYRSAIEAIAGADPALYPVLGRMRMLLEDHAASIRSGGIEWMVGGPGGPLAWPADQYVHIDLVARDAVDGFYSEALAVLTGLLEGGATGDGDEERSILDEAVTLNRAMLRVPGPGTDAHVVLSHDVLELWKRSGAGEAGELPDRVSTYRIERSRRSWESIGDWAAFLTWCHRHNKRAYLHDAVPVRAPTAVAS